MKLEEFREALRSVIGPDIEDMWVERFFSEVRRNKDVSVKVVIKKKSTQIIHYIHPTMP